jgi:hypothetical protein
MSFFEGYQQTVFFIFSEMTAPSTSEIVDVYTVNYLSTRNYTMSVTVTNIDTSVVVRLEGTVDGTNFGPLLSETITENGTYVYNSVGFPMRKLRTNFFRENGGTNAVVKFSVAAN